MAQHDYVIDNQASAPARTDINNALLAIVTQNSGDTAPATTYANMIWYETDTNTLWKRNEANSGWISMGTFDESALTFTPSGTPSIATQAEAEAGSNNTKMMTPLRTSQAIAALQNMVLLGTLTTTSGTTQTLSSLTLSSYTALLVIVSGASHNGSGGSSQNLNFGTAQITTGGPYNATTLVSGFALVPLGTGLSIGLVAADGTSPSFRAAASGYSTATTSVSFTWSSGAAFDAGTIKIYGIKA